MSVSIQFTNHHMASSENLKQLTRDKFSRLYKFAPKITKIHVTFSIDKLMHIAEAEVHIPNMNPIHAKAQCEYDLYESLDLLVDKLTKQLSKHKEKTTEH